jgi:hypothetical protein
VTRCFYISHPFFHASHGSQYNVPAHLKQAYITIWVRRKPRPRQIRIQAIQWHKHCCMTSILIPSILPLKQSLTVPTDSPRQLYDPNMDPLRLHSSIPTYSSSQTITSCPPSLPAHLLEHHRRTAHDIRLQNEHLGYGCHRRQICRRIPRRRPTHRHWEARQQRPGRCDDPRKSLKFSPRNVHARYVSKLIKDAS